MTEIATMFREGMQQIGIESQLLFDTLPPHDLDPQHLPVVVAPHEFDALVLGPNATVQHRRSVASRVYVLNTEQPGSTWFNRALRFARHSRGVFDINRQAVREFRRRGVPVAYTPLGYAPSLEHDCGAELSNEKPIDIVFLGHQSERRNRFFSQYAEFFTRYNCRIILSDVASSRLVTDTHCYSGSERCKLLRSAKILINVHAFERSYFESHRILNAMANSCLVVSETSEHSDPFVDGQHIVLADLGQITEKCDRYLKSPEERKRIVSEAYHLLRRDCSIRDSCSILVNREFQAPEQLAVRCVGTVGRLASLPYRGGRHLFRLVKRNPYASRLIDFLPLLARILKRREIEIKRHAVQQRLNESSRQAETGEESQLWKSTSNAAFSAATDRSITVIITLFNYAAYILDALESLAACESKGIPKGFDVIIVDDASSDGSAEIVRKFMKESSLPVRLVCKQLNTGLADTRNIGLNLTSAPYVFTLDADNTVFPECLTKLYAAITSTRSEAAYGIIAKRDDASGEGIGLLSYMPWSVPRLVFGPYIDAMALFDREALLAIGGYSNELFQHGWFGWEDYDVWLSYATAGYECAFVPEIVAAYRVHSKAMVNTTVLYAGTFAELFRQKHAGLLESLEIGDCVFGNSELAAQLRNRASDKS